MKPTDPIPHSPSVPCGRLLRGLLLATGILLASSMPMKASWLWVLAPVALLMLLDITSSSRATRLGSLAFYGAVVAVALAFQFIALAEKPPPKTAIASTCGSGGCGTSAGCGHG